MSSSESDLHPRTAGGRAPAKATRALYLLAQYPQVSETYIQCELDAVHADHDVVVVSMSAVAGSATETKRHSPYCVVTGRGQLQRIFDEFRPSVIHTHWLIQIAQVAAVARAMSVTFTVRAHSFDTIPSADGRVKAWFENAPRVLRDVTRDELCLGVLAFPFSRVFLESCGVPTEKIHDCYPIIDYRRFHDPSPNQAAIMNTGACLPKKRMEDFLKLAQMTPELRFNLYPVSYQNAALKRHNVELGEPVNFFETLEPEDMPTEYKKHRWMVYTACPRLKNVGWPVSIAEAQAAGVGVVMANIRPDLGEYVGDAGFLYDSLAQARAIISKPFPKELRDQGFELAKRCDVRRHHKELTALWAKA